MKGIGVPEILLILLIAMLMGFVFRLIPFWQIYKKAGYPPARSILMMIPVVSVVMLFVLAFSKWPASGREAS